MSLNITQREQTWVLEIKERWMFDDDEACMKVIRYLVQRTIPFRVDFDVARFIAFNDVRIHNNDFVQFSELVNEIMKLKKAYGDVNSKLPG